MKKIGRVILGNCVGLLSIFSYMYLSENEYVALFSSITYVVIAICLTRLFGWRRFWLWEFKGKKGKSQRPIAVPYKIEPRKVDGKNNQKVFELTPDMYEGLRNNDRFRKKSWEWGGNRRLI